MGLADEKGWQVEADARTYGLHVVLLKREYVLPWVQFLYAEGTEDSIRQCSARTMWRFRAKA